MKTTCQNYILADNDSGSTKTATKGYKTNFDELLRQKNKRCCNILETLMNLVWMFYMYVSDVFRYFNMTEAK